MLLARLQALPAFVDAARAQSRAGPQAFVGIDKAVARRRQQCLRQIPLDSLAQLCGMYLSFAHRRRSDMNRLLPTLPLFAAITASATVSYGAAFSRPHARRMGP